MLFSFLIKFHYSLLSLIIFSLIKQSTPKVIDYNRDNSLIDKLKLLGYLEPFEQSNDEFSLVEISNAIKLYETFYSTSFEGALNQPIISKLLDSDETHPRCSIPDIVNHAKTIQLLSSKKTSRHLAAKKLTSSNIKKEILFKFQIVSKWFKHILKWSLINTSSTLAQLSFEETKYALEKAFNTWSFYSNLTFIYTNQTNTSDLLIQFSTPHEHNQKCDFKFTNASYAHAYYPTKGIGHFQVDKLWSLNDTINHSNMSSNRHFNLISVAIHEIGHLLGFGHSSNPKSIMFPDYRADLETRNYTFHMDDVKILQHLYGKNEILTRIIEYKDKNL